jgi:hypothetical protein
MSKTLDSYLATANDTDKSPSERRAAADFILSQSMKALASIPPDPDTKVKRLKLDADLSDGQHWTITDRPGRDLIESIGEWMQSADPGDTVTIEVVEMTDAEVAALPERAVVGCIRGQEPTSPG